MSDKKITHIKNPLTIIAIFSSLVEISGVIVFPSMGTELQGIFIWFLIAFPLLLVLMFFLTLNFNQKVLYSPSDFQNENNYMETFKIASAAERNDKLVKDIKLSKYDEFHKDYNSLPDKHPSVVEKHMDVNVFERYKGIEDSAIQMFSNQTKIISEGPIIVGSLGSEERYIYSGHGFDSEKELHLIDVKFLSNDYMQTNHLESLMKTYRLNLKKWFGYPEKKITINFIGIYNDTDRLHCLDILDKLSSKFNLNIRIYLYNESQLK